MESTQSVTGKLANALSLRRCSSRRWLIDRPIEVFLSSTSSLMNERQAVKGALDASTYHLFCFEEHPAEKRSPKTVCAEKIDQADVFLGLIGPDFGSPLPDNPNCGIVHWEFERARTRAKCSELEIKSYLRDDAIDAATDERQRQFIENLTGFNTGLYCKWFTNTRELHKTVQIEMHAWLEKYRTALDQHTGDIRHFADRLLTPVVLLAAGASLVAGILAITDVITCLSAVLATSVSISLMLACFFLQRQV